MLIGSVVLYLFFTLLIGVWASKRVRNSEDYILAGKNLPAFMVGVTIFCTWFGSEMIMGVPAYFVKEGLKGLIIDIGGSLLCLTAISLFFTKPIYRLRIYTVNDYFRLRFSRGIESVTSVIIVLSYFSWVASQLLALALLFNSLFAMSIGWGIFTSALIVLFYTYIGGMWAVSVTDLIQAVVITIGLVFILISLYGKTEGVLSIFNKTPSGFFSLLPQKNGIYVWTDYINKWIIFGVGAIVSQEVYQRMLAAKSEKHARAGVFLGGILMVIIGILPSLAGLIISQLHPELMSINDGQSLLPEMVSKYMTIPIQILFYGALISAILSTASGAMLAPATVLAENLFKSGKINFSDRRLLLTTRLCVVFMAFFSGLYAYFNNNIHLLVVDSVTLITVSMTAPFVFGIYWKKTSVFGVWAAVISGILVWAVFNYSGSRLAALIPGILASVIAVISGSLYKRDNSHQMFIDNLEKNQ